MAVIHKLIPNGQWPLTKNLAFPESFVTGLVCERRGG